MNRFGVVTENVCDFELYSLSKGLSA